MILCGYPQSGLVALALMISASWPLHVYSSLFSVSSSPHPYDLLYMHPDTTKKLFKELLDKEAEEKINK